MSGNVGYFINGPSGRQSVKEQIKLMACLQKFSSELCLSANLKT